MGHPAIGTVTLANDTGIEVELLNLGATIRAIRVPTQDDRVNTVLSYRHTEDYLADPYYLGATVGRYANRIENARFVLEGTQVGLQPTPGQRGHCLHGGPRGFSHRTWKPEDCAEPDAIRFTLDSRDGDQGFPGAVRAAVTYRLLDGLKLSMEFVATSDAPTVVNLANHAYFNLNNDGTTADNHRVCINAERITPVAENLVPTGEFRDVAGTPFDFRTPAVTAERLRAKDSQLLYGAGFDHNFVLSPGVGDVGLAAELESPQSGLRLRIYTDQPGLQFYSGQHLAAPFRPFEGICLEAQNFPNAPNTPGFPSARLYPGQVYRKVTIYEFTGKSGGQPRS